ncbi:hypothetical protein [Rhodopirellula sp. MGV]|uniref:hypothetical protein n=1 Tax=Rhodopirellula sp. MGV TaxID=2023130 RepID=UPI000B96FEF1|nr:hypothetical protein [Rhodopirellula sp. MGV]OYP37053.1 hypothetical protein CGZ80_06810 [Rhodopirellula sp. MGV]PNY36184.1 hypothetical protein C2E31_13770 [Rhodopirellula baltica]
MDLWVAIAFIAAVSGLAFIAGWKLSLSVYRTRPLLLIECILLLLVFAFGLANRLFWASAIPNPAAMCWSNWLPVFLCFAAGLATHVCALRPSWRGVTALAMLSLAVAFLLQPVMRPNLYPISIAEEADWDHNVCLQSDGASCGPAAAATLLRHHSMLDRAKRQLGWEGRSSEAMMANLCLTSSQGTSSLGLVRGLRLAIDGSRYNVSVASDNPTTWNASGQLPNLAVVCFRGGERNDPVRRLLGTDGEAHAVMVLGRTPQGLWKIGDPAVGWRLYTDEYFRRIFTGEAIYLAKR